MFNSAFFCAALHLHDKEAISKRPSSPEKTPCQRKRPALACQAPFLCQDWRCSGRRVLSRRWNWLVRMEWKDACLWILLAGGLLATGQAAGGSGCPPLDNPYGEHEFLAACRSGNVPAVRFFLAQPGFDPDSQWPSGRSGSLVNGLLLAAQQGHLEVVQLLIAAGATPDKPTDLGATPVLIATLHDQVPVIRVLAEAGANLDQVDLVGLSPLMVAVSRRSLQLVSALLDGGARVDRPDCFGGVPLVVAAGLGVEPIVERLLQAGADPNGTRGGREVEGVASVKPLVAAAAAGHGGVVDKLLAAGASPLCGPHPGREGPLLLAASAGYGGIVRSLVRAGAGRGNEAVQALVMAAYSGYNTVVSALLDAGVSPNVFYDGVTALMAAAARNHVEVVRNLLRRGADLDLAQADGSSALFMATNTGATAVVRSLLEAGARTDSGPHGVTPLFAALLGRHQDALALFLDSERVDLLRPCYGVPPLVLARMTDASAEVVNRLARAAATGRRAGGCPQCPSGGSAVVSPPPPVSRCDHDPDLVSLGWRAFLLPFVDSTAGAANSAPPSSAPASGGL